MSDKTILEITPGSKTRYTMPEATFNVVGYMLDVRLAVSVMGALKLLPSEIRDEVGITALPASHEGMYGHSASMIVIDEVGELTSSEAAALTAPPAAPAQKPDDA